MNTKDKNFKIGFIGCNNMSGAILQGALKQGVIFKENAYVYDISPSVIERMTELGVNVVNNNEELCRLSDIIILGTKPHHVGQAIAECGVALQGKALVSVAAGITTGQLQDLAGGKTRIMRTMPNTPAMVGAGVTAFCKETDLLEEEVVEIEKIFQGIGVVEWVEERLINVVAAISGSGPAFIAMFAEALADGGVKNGLSRELCYQLAAQTLVGTGKMLLDTGLHPGQLKDMVSSPGGTTIEGIEALEEGNLRYAVIDCVNRATNKATKLTKD
jgi:pyrroline-5-carboxylate reductase